MTPREAGSIGEVVGDGRKVLIILGALDTAKKAASLPHHATALDAAVELPRLHHVELLAQVALPDERLAGAELERALALQVARQTSPNVAKLCQALLKNEQNLARFRLYRL